MAFITNITTTPVTNSYGADGRPLYIDNDMGSVRGNLGDRSAASSGSLGGVAFGEGNPVITIVSGVGGVVSANQNASINAGTQVISVAQTGIAGIANTTLQGGQSDSANAAYTPLQETAVRTYFYKTAVVAGNWNVFDGTFSSITNVVSGAWDIAASTDDAADIRAAGTDITANPTQDAPGQLTYRNGSPNPINDDYNARYNW